MPELKLPPPPTPERLHRLERLQALHKLSSDRCSGSDFHQYREEYKALVGEILSEHKSMAEHMAGENLPDPVTSRSRSTKPNMTPPVSPEPTDPVAIHPCLICGVVEANKGWMKIKCNCCTYAPREMPWLKIVESWNFFNDPLRIVLRWECVNCSSEGYIVYSTPKFRVCYCFHCKIAYSVDRKTSFQSVSTHELEKESAMSQSQNLEEHKLQLEAACNQIRQLWAEAEANGWTSQWQPITTPLGTVYPRIPHSIAVAL